MGFNTLDRRLEIGYRESLKYTSDSHRRRGRSYNLRSCPHGNICETMPLPSDQELERELRNVLRSANTEELSLKRLRAQLEDKYQVQSCGHFLPCPY